MCCLRDHFSALALGAGLGFCPHGGKLRRAQVTCLPALPGEYGGHTGAHFSAVPVTLAKKNLCLPEVGAKRCRVQDSRGPTLVPRHSTGSPPSHSCPDSAQLPAQPRACGHAPGLCAELLPQDLSPAVYMARGSRLTSVLSLPEGSRLREALASLLLCPLWCASLADIQCILPVSVFYSPSPTGL